MSERTACYSAYILELHKISVFNTSVTPLALAEKHPSLPQEYGALSSDLFSSELNDRQRFNLWSELHNAEIAALDYSMADAIPFRARIDLIALGKVNLGETTGTIKAVERTHKNILRDSGSGYSLFVNTGHGSLAGNHLDREFVLGAGDAAMISNTETVSLLGGSENSWLCIVLPERALIESFGSPNDYLSYRIDTDTEALKLLRRYAGFLATGGAPTSETLLTHTADAIIDLVGLSVGMKGRGSKENGGGGGLRAARLLAIEQKIDSQFENHQISAQMVALQLGLSARYVHDLLQETGVGFSERVMELRLTRTYAMLTARQFSHMRVSDVALACGFSDISYFNRCFRRRFGCTPTAAR